MLDPQHIITTVGLIGVAIIIFAESGILLGFFLPGDTLLFTAGFLASQGYFNLYVLIAVCFIAAVTGDSVGYSIGHKLGPKLFTKNDSLLFDQDNITRAQRFYEVHGGKTVLLARFIPIVRTFVPVVAGVGKMRYRHFLIFNIIGGAVWVFGVTLLGHWLGAKIPNIDNYIFPILALIIVGSFGSSFVHILANKKSRAHLKNKINNFKAKLFKK